MNELISRGDVLLVLGSSPSTKPGRIVMFTNLFEAAAKKKQAVVTVSPAAAVSRPPTATASAAPTRAERK